MTENLAPDPKLMVVVHAEEPNTVIDQVALAQWAGADGVFLINHYRSAASLMANYLAAQAELPNFMIGVNNLHVLASDIPKFLDSVGIYPTAIWNDDAGVTGSLETARATYDYLHLRPQPVSYFGGVAHKGASYVSDPSEAAKLAQTAAPFMDVVTTTGLGTGKEALPEKLMAMKRALGSGALLGLASGVSIENVEQYLGYVDHFIVASSLEKTYGKLDEPKVSELAAAVHRAG